MIKIQLICLGKGKNYSIKFFRKSDQFRIFYKMMYLKWEKVYETYYMKDPLFNWGVIEMSDDLLHKDNYNKLKLNVGIILNQGSTLLLKRL